MEQHHNFRELAVWKLARELVKDVYGLSAGFPLNEQFGLTSQVRRAMVSVSSNIAEGSGRGTNRDFVRFLGIALASSFEVETQLILAEDLAFLPASQVEASCVKLHQLQ